MSIVKHFLTYTKTKEARASVIRNMQKIKSISKRFAGATFFKFAAVFMIFLWVILARIDLDFGWHLQAGNYIRNHGIPATDVFTYTAPNFSWINHEWANDIILSQVHDIGGYVLLAVMFALIWTSALMISGHKARLFTLILAASALIPYVGVRAVAWTVLFLAILIKLKSSSYKYLAIPLFFVWANLHGGFAVGLAVLGFFAIKYRQKEWLYILFFSFLATMLNPYGPRIYEEIGRTMLDSSLHTQIKEWRVFTVFEQSYPYFLAWAAGFWVYSRHKLRNWFSLGPIFFAAALSATRHMPLFVIVTTTETDRFLQKFADELPDSTPKLKKATIYVVAALMLGWIMYSNKAQVASLPDPERRYPTHAVAYLQDNPCPGRLFNSYNYGGYLIWRLPSHPVYIDGRMPSWHNSETGEKYLDRYYGVLNNPDTRRTEFEKYNITCALLSGESASMVKNLKDDGWEEAVRASGSILLLSPEQ